MATQLATASTVPDYSSRVIRIPAQAWRETVQRSLGTVLLALAVVLLAGKIWAQGKFVYTNDDRNPNTVSGFSVASDGTLTAIAGSPFATGGHHGGGQRAFAPNRIAVAGNFLFASNSQSSSVSVFTINPSTGVLTLVPGSFFTGGAGTSFGIAVSPTPDGRFLMVADSDFFNRSYSITVFSITSNGALTPIAGSPFATLYLPLGIKVSPDGKFLAVALYSNQVQIFSIGPNGFLTSVDVFTGKGISSSVAGVDIDCSSSFLYAGEATSGTVVDALNINSNGMLSPIAGSPFKPAVGENSSVVLLSPDNKTLFVSNQGSNTMTVFSVAPDGSLSPLAGSPFPMNGHKVFRLEWRQVGMDACSTWQTTTPSSPYSMWRALVL